MSQIPIPSRPAAIDAPRYRYWGDRRPPENREDMFSIRVNAVTTVPVPAAGTATADPVAGNVATIRMYGPIDSWGGYWGISAKDVSAALDALGADVTEIRVRINSPGGESWEAMAILNMLRAHSAKVVAVVDGIAASAASFIAAGCDETIMSPGTEMMLHDASTIYYGNAGDFRKQATALDTTSNSIASIYAEATGGSIEDWRAVMVEETWYTALEAAAAGLADAVAVVSDAGPTSTAGEEPEPPVIVVVADEVEDLFDLSIFNYAGRSRAPAPAAVSARSTHRPPTASADGSITTEGSTAMSFSDEQLATMRQELGVAEDADEATIVAALTEALSERAEAPATPTTPANTAPVPDGFTLIPDTAYEELRTNATAGAAAAEQLRIQERSRFLDQHADRFLPANRADWEARYDTAPTETRTYLAQAPVLVPMSEIGHDVTPSGQSAANTDDSWFPQYGDPATPKGA